MLVCLNRQLFFFLRIKSSVEVLHVWRRKIKGNVFIRTLFKGILPLFKANVIIALSIY